MKQLKKVFLEIVIILFSVLIFRSLWLLMDSVVYFNYLEFHISALIIGIVLSIFAFRKLISIK